MFYNNYKIKEKIEKIDLFEISKMPNKEINKDLFMETIGNNLFIIIYNFNNKKMYLGYNQKISNEKNKEIEKAIPGLEMKFCNTNVIEASKFHIFSTYRNPNSIYLNFMSDIFDIELDSGFFAILFLPAAIEEVNKSKKYIEDMLSRKTIKQTVSESGGFLNKYSTKSSHRDLFENLDEQILLNNVLNSINNAILSNNIKYKILFISNEDSKIKNYISSRFILLDENENNYDNIETAIAKSSNLSGFIFGIDYARNLLNFYGMTGISYVIPSISPDNTGNIPIGTYMKNSVYKSSKVINIDISSMNLGFILSGLPGSGKTSEAKSIINSVITYKEKETDFRNKNGNGIGIIIISPTNEWNEFALNHKMNLIQLFNDRIPINFFRCPDEANEERFYSDLAMILSSASKSGPYENPMEKCMINAFRQIYKKSRKPDPIEVYNEIEKSIIKFHAKKNNVGVQYTKHGENIKSSLENLRNILNRPEYSIKNGIKLEELFDNGIVFDISKVSNNDKIYMYALILNQVYSFTSKFDTNGDNDLRFIICIEEAQLIFERSKLKESAAVKDLKFRIQDFRKKGIGLMLLTHNINNIDPEIRRLCQIKLYLKQPPDIAEIASEDLIFTFSNKEEIISKLKHLDSRIGAFNYIIKENDKKISNDTIFIETYEYKEIENKENKNLIEEYLEKNKINYAREHICNIIVIKKEVQKNEKDMKNLDYIKNEILSLRINYLNDEIIEYELKNGHNEFKLNLLLNHKYTFQFLNNKKRVIYSELKDIKKHINIEINNLGIYFGN